MQYELHLFLFPAVFSIPLEPSKEEATSAALIWASILAFSVENSKCKNKLHDSAFVTSRNFIIIKNNKQRNIQIINTPGDLKYTWVQTKEIFVLAEYMH